MANAIRALAMDAVQAANSGHPGMPMGMAEIALALWRRHLRHNPANPKWADRDRFVLSNGHGSMLLYALLHLTGYDLPLDGAEALPPARLDDARPPGARRRARRRDDHRPARAGARERGRHGARRAPPRDGVQPSGLRDRRPLHLRVRRRRLPHGGDLARGLLAGGHARPRQADRPLRRQRHLDRRPRPELVHRRHAEALRGVRLARRGGRRRARRRGGRRRDPGRAARARPAEPRLLQDADRQGCADEGEHPRSARCAARQGGDRGDARRDRLDAPAVRGAAQRLRGVGRARGRRGRGVGVERAVRALPAQVPGPRRAVPAPHGGRAARRLAGARARA